MWARFATRLLCAVLLFAVCAAPIATGAPRLRFGCTCTARLGDVQLGLGLNGTVSFAITNPGTNGCAYAWELVKLSGNPAVTFTPASGTLTLGPGATQNLSAGIVITSGNPGEEAVIGLNVKRETTIVCQAQGRARVVQIAQSGNPTNSLWWFNGANAANYAEQVTLTANGANGAQFKWTVTQGTTKVDFSNGMDEITTNGNTTPLSSTAASAAAAVVTNDVTIQLTIGGQLVCTFDTVVLAPDHLVHISNTDNAVGDGYRSLINYRSEDQFNQVLPADIEVNEDWGATASDAAGENWLTWNVTAPCGDATFENCEGSSTVGPAGWADNLTALTYNAAPAMIQPPPAPQNPQAPLGMVKVDHRPGTWRHGSTTTNVGPANNRGIVVRTLTWQRYRDHARHE